MPARTNTLQGFAANATVRPVSSYGWHAELSETAITRADRRFPELIGTDNAGAICVTNGPGDAPRPNGGRPAEPPGGCNVHKSASAGVLSSQRGERKFCLPVSFQCKSQVSLNYDS